jgi:hypothetical protein
VPAAPTKVSAPAKSLPAATKSRGRAVDSFQGPRRGTDDRFQGRRQFVADPYQGRRLVWPD